MGQKTQVPIDQIDRFTGFPVGIISDHSYIHDGIGFQLAGSTGSIASAGTYVISLTTPTNGKFIHFRPSAISSTANLLQMRLAEKSVVSGGSAGIPMNKNRNSKKSSTMTVGLGVTLSSEGAIMEYTQAGSGTNAGNASGGGSSGAEHEWVLKPGTTYSLRFENIGSTTATIGYYNLFWYEEGSA